MRFQELATLFDLFARRGRHSGRNAKIMRRRNRGASFRALRPLFKLSEEVNELGAVLAKLAMWHADDCVWENADYAARLPDWLHEELGDVLATMLLVVKRYRLDWARIEARAQAKLKRFAGWGM